MSFTEIGTKAILHKEIILKTPEAANKVATCPGKKFQHLFPFTSRDSFFSSLILYSNFYYAFV